jgi:hypothetical protein
MYILYKTGLDYLIGGRSSTYLLLAVPLVEYRYN